MLAGGADFRCLGAFADVTAVAALPPDFVVADEEILKTQEEPLYYFTPVSAAVAAPPFHGLGKRTGGF